MVPRTSAGTVLMMCAKVFDPGVTSSVARKSLSAPSASPTHVTRYRLAAGCCATGAPTHSSRRTPKTNNERRMWPAVLEVVLQPELDDARAEEPDHVLPRRTVGGLDVGDRVAVGQVRDLEARLKPLRAPAEGARDSHVDLAEPMLAIERRRLDQLHRLG